MIIEHIIKFLFIKTRVEKLFLSPRRFYGMYTALLHHNSDRAVRPYTGNTVLPA